MAFKRFANAIVAQQGIHFEQWMDELRAQNEGVAPKEYIGRVAKTLLKRCDVKRYLLSHATIVASVDTYAPKGSKTGRRMLNGVEIDVKFPDFRVKPECHEIINNNGDFWSRPLLLSTYRTFIGSHNYLEHIQIPELSKGFIVDAVARDLGKSVYIDILVATDRKHKLLINDILSGEINALSMGCITQFTVCSKCGNVAIDDSMLCPCVLYEGKGTKFIDEEGINQIISEQCGHVTVPNSNTFIEASWVRHPAFAGAVRRSILNPDVQVLSSKINEAASIYELRCDIMGLDGMKRAAAVKMAQGDDEAPKDDAPEAPKQPPPIDSEDEPDDASPADDAGTDETDADAGDAGDAGEDKSGETADKPAKMKELLEKVQEQLLDSIVKGLEDQLQPKPNDVGVIVPPTRPAKPADTDIDTQNDNVLGSTFNRRLCRIFGSSPQLVKWAVYARRVVGNGIPAVKAAGFTSKDLIVLSWIEDVVRSREYPADLYKVAMLVGPLKSYPSEVSYLAACRVKLGRALTSQEKQFFSWKGHIASLSVNF